MNNSLFKLVPLQYKNIENTKERLFISMKSDKIKFISNKPYTNISYFFA